MTTIPQITHPLGRHWKQPARDKFLIDDKHALMDEDTYNQFPEYSATIPTGVYDGKCWVAKRHGKFYLHWYGPCDRDDQCAIFTREILFLDI